LQAPPHHDTTPDLWAFYQNEAQMWEARAKEILPPKRYEVFLLMAQEFSRDEIARATGKAPGTVQKQMWEIRNTPELRAMGAQIREEQRWARPVWDFGGTARRGTEL
jgi:DNA-directed RNA polymerase specialized sigma24 family protein